MILPTAAYADHAKPGTSDKAVDAYELERGTTRIAYLLTRMRRHGLACIEAGVDVNRAAMTVLRVLADADCPLRPGEIAIRLDVAAPHITRQLQLLQHAGFINRIADPNDGRAHLIQITYAGHEVVDAVRAVDRRHMADALADWPADDLRLLARLHHRMVNDLLRHARQHA
ncbi:MarR family winged helix-turn-helix transcriptional regulator [Nocardia sp. CA-136227]|uniref:MarR family winged helix-turn-helix transcriptional regulator n=1 Tax=Nocardia sp. CA-136227 TaxID=3239979 RepID=UPI003D9882EC